MVYILTSMSMISMTVVLAATLTSIFVHSREQLDRILSALTADAGLTFSRDSLLIGLVHSCDRSHTEFSPDPNPDSLRENERVRTLAKINSTPFNRDIVDMAAS